MDLLLVVLALLLQGLVIGALGRFAVPGRNPMSITQTILVGVAGSFLGGLAGWVVLGRPGGLLLGVLAAALLVWLVERRRRSAGRRAPERR